jgi:hypothetical protein
LGALSKAGALGAVGAAAYAFGTQIDKWTGASDAISSALAGKQKDLTGNVGTNQAQAVEALARQADQLLGLRAAGVQTFGKQGEQKALTTENIMQNLREAAARQGIPPEMLAKLIPALETLASGTASPVNVVVKAPGIDKPSVQVSRGGAVT